MSPQMINSNVTSYVHYAYLAFRALLKGELDYKRALVILQQCKEGLEKLGYSFALIKQTGVVAYKK